MYKLVAQINGVNFDGYTADWNVTSETIESLLKVTDKVYVTKAGSETGRMFTPNGPALGIEFDVL